MLRVTALAALLTGLAVVPASGAATSAATASGQGLRAACPAARPGHVRCFVLYSPGATAGDTAAAGAGRAASKPHGWSPQDIQAAYKLPVQQDPHQTVAVSIAFSTPGLAHYLAVYRSYYHLPPCTAASGCLRIVNQRGHSSPLPASGAGSGWDLEATLDVSMISAACPHCHILVVEGDDDSIVNMAVTEDTAARLGAPVISNSYGTRENGYVQTLSSHYEHPGHLSVVASGDAGFTAAQWPASLASVTAVGGTALRRAGNARGFTERVWNQPSIFAAGGSGCSAYVAKPAWQHDGHCPGRTVSDVSALATNVPIYEPHYGGWVTVAGTSASAPLIAGVYGLAGNASQLTGPAGVYQHRRALFDITTGNNVLLETCGGDYLCTARKGYDAPTGLGTPDGTGAF